MGGSVETPTLDSDWTIVVTRRGKKNARPATKLRKQPPTDQPLAWAPADSEIDPLRESKIKEKVRFSTEKLKASKFFCALLDQIDSPEIALRFRSVLGADQPDMNMVVYGIGSIESYENPRLQLSLALLLKRKLDWIGNVEIFDPVLSATETRVMESLGCTVLSINENGRRRADKPTLFLMPHCEAELYDNLLRENWKVELLSNVALLGNSFENYEELSAFNFKRSVADSARHVLYSRKFAAEFKIATVSDEYFSAFHDSSWHFFSPSMGTELPLIQ